MNVKINDQLFTVDETTAVASAQGEDFVEVRVVEGKDLAGNIFEGCRLVLPKSMLIPCNRNEIGVECKP